MPSGNLPNIVTEIVPAGVFAYIGMDVALAARKERRILEKGCEISLPELPNQTPTDPKDSKWFATLPERDHSSSSSKRPTKQKVANLPELYRPVAHNADFMLVKSLDDIRRNPDHIVAAFNPKTRKVSLFITPNPAKSYPVCCLDKLKEWKRRDLIKSEVYGYVGVALSGLYAARQLVYR